MVPIRHREGNNDSKRYYDWIDRAGEDLKAAKLLLASDDTLFSATFHCQQCIEKGLKGYILFKTKSHVDGHNLTWLCRQAIKSDQRFLKWLDESAMLNRYYIETRYPSDIPFVLNREKVSRVYNMAISMYNFICGEIQ
jgi:HEPN domain-containing protein